MPFQLVYLSQQDPRWKADILGFGDPGDTIGYIGCALTATAMLLSGHGYAETPKSLNKKLKDVNGFVSAAILWSAVSKIYPNVSLKAYIPCATSDAPLAQIDAAIEFVGGRIEASAGLRLPALGEYLAAAAAGEQKDRMIIISADATAAHQSVINVMDAARRGGVAEWFTPVAGNEVTTPAGHFNVFPVDPAAPPPMMPSRTHATTSSMVSMPLPPNRRSSPSPPPQASASAFATRPPRERNAPSIFFSFLQVLSATGWARRVGWHPTGR